MSRSPALDVQKKPAAALAHRLTFAPQRGFDALGSVEADTSAFIAHRPVLMPQRSVTSAVRNVQSNTAAPTKTGQSGALVTPWTCPFGGAHPTCPTRVHAKLFVGQPDDEYEREEHGDGRMLTTERLTTVRLTAIKQDADKLTTARLLAVRLSADSYSPFPLATDLLITEDYL
jgi:hypothetical protein